MGIVVLKRRPVELREFKLVFLKKRELERQTHELAILMRERYGYTIDDEKLSNAIWHLYALSLIHI